MKSAKGLFIIAILIISFSLYWIVVKGRPHSAVAGGVPTMVMGGGEPEGGDFTLHSADGPLSLHDLKGKVVLLFFGYTNCPAACPTTLITLKAVVNHFNKAEQELIRVLFITIDPERDTAEKLKEYVGYFHPNFIGLTGSQDEILKVSDQYKALYFKENVPDSAVGYSFIHATTINLINQEGELIDHFSHGASVERMTEAVRIALDGGHEG
ncbi:MAG: SCO family protein [Thermodesulfobacteriota bacterium]